MLYLTFKYANEDQPRVFSEMLDNVSFQDRLTSYYHQIQIINNNMNNSLKSLLGDNKDIEYIKVAYKTPDNIIREYTHDEINDIQYRYILGTNYIVQATLSEEEENLWVELRMSDRMEILENEENEEV